MYYVTFRNDGYVERAAFKYKNDDFNYDAFDAIKELLQHAERGYNFTIEYEEDF